MICILVIVIILILCEQAASGLGTKKKSDCENQVDKICDDLEYYEHLTYEYFLRREIEILCEEMRIIEFAMYHSLPVTGFPVMEPCECFDIPVEEYQ